MKAMRIRKALIAILATGIVGTGAFLLYAGKGNSFQFDKTVYNLNKQKTTAIIAVPEAGYKFSGEGARVSGQSTIAGTDVTLRLSWTKNDTKVKGRFVPDGTVPGEAEIWIESQAVTVINHLIRNATYDVRSHANPVFTMFRAKVIA